MITLEQDENVIIREYRHWFVFLSHVIGFVVLAVAPLVLASIYASLGGNAVTLAVPGNISLLITFGSSVWYLALWVAFFMQWTTFFLDTIIVTDKRVIYVNQEGLFARRVSTSSIDRIQDVTVRVEGLIPTFFNFGTVAIQTAAEEEKFTIHGIADPDEIKESVLEARRKSTASASTGV